MDWYVAVLMGLFSVQMQPTYSASTSTVDVLLSTASMNSPNPLMT